MKRALACFLTAIACLYAATAHADFIGSYDVGDTITLHCAVNDNGTAADSVSGDSVKAIIYWEGARVDTVGLALAGASLPTSAAFFAKIAADTTVGPSNQGGYGTWWAVLWAVNVGAGTRDPVGTLTWQLEPKIASASGIVPRVTLSDSVVGVANVQHTVLVDSTNTAGDAGLGAISDTIWTRNLNNVAWNGKTAAHALTNLFRERMAGFYLGDFQQGDSITIGARFNTVDSVYAFIFWEDDAIDTLKLTSTAQGYYANIMADTTGAGWGSWRALLRGYVNGILTTFPQYVSNSWTMTDLHLYAQEIGESADVYIHDPADSTVALVVRDTLNAWADSFKADTVVAVTNDTFHLDILDWGPLSNRIADTIWAGGEETRSLSAAEYGEIADSVGTNIAALDTIAYVTNVGTVTLADSVRVVRRSLALTLADSLVAAQRVRDVVLPIDSVIAVKRLWDLDSARVIATALLVDSARIVASCDSVGKVDTVRAVALLSGMTPTLRGIIADTVWNEVVIFDTTAPRETLTARETLARSDTLEQDSMRVVGRSVAVTLADSVTGLRRMVNPLDSVVAVARAWDLDSARVVRRSLAVTLADSVTGVRRLNGRVDSVTGVYRVAIVDSATMVATVDSAGEVRYADTLRAAFRTRLNDSTVAAHRVQTAAVATRTDSAVTMGVLPVSILRAIADSVWGEIAIFDTVAPRETLTAKEVLARSDTAAVESVTAVGRVQTVVLAESLAAGYRIRFVDDVDSTRALARVWTADSLRIARRTILTDSTTGAARVKIVDSTASVGVIPAVDSVTAVSRVWDVDSTRALDHARLVSQVTLGDSVTGVARVLLTSTTSVATVVDSARTTAGVTGLTTTTIANAVSAKTVGGSANTFGRILAEIDTVTATVRDSVQTTAISTLAHTGDAMTLTGADKAAVADSTWYYLQLNASYPAGSPGNLLWNIQEDSLATITQIAGADADSMRAILAASALQDSLDSLTTRLGRSGDSTLADLSEYIANNLQTVQFPTSAIAELRDSLWGTALDSLGELKGGWDSSTAAAHLWDASPKHHGQDFEAIDSSTVDTSNVRLGIFHSGGSPISGTEVYVYTLADSGWSQPIGEDLEPNADGRWWVPVYVPANGDTVYYRVRFHAPGYIDQTKIVRFPQP